MPAWIPSRSFPWIPHRHRSLITPTLTRTPGTYGHGVTSFTEIKGDTEQPIVNVTSGYDANVENVLAATATFRANTSPNGLDAVGSWYWREVLVHTGDLGVLDEEGYNKELADAPEDVVRTSRAAAGGMSLKSSDG
jgi:hypothetical protein